MAVQGSAGARLWAKSETAAGGQSVRDLGTGHEAWRDLNRQVAALWGWLDRAEAGRDSMIRARNFWRSVAWGLGVYVLLSLVNGAG